MDDKTNKYLPGSQRVLRILKYLNWSPLERVWFHLRNALERLFCLGELLRLHSFIYIRNWTFADEPVFPQDLVGRRVDIYLSIKSE